MLFFLVCFLSFSNSLAQTGNVGINTITPDARIHVIRNASSGGPLLTNAFAIFEDNQNSYIHLSHLNTNETGILSGDQSNLIRSGIIFGSDSSVLLRSGGNINRMVIKGNRVGINTISPLAMFHVKDSSVVFTAGPLPQMPGNPPVTGPGTRFMWYPAKAAFRMGRVTNTNWDKDSIGIYSAAFGFNSKAKGNASMAVGFNAMVTGNNSMSFGQDTKASGLNSIALGHDTEASGSPSLASGGNSKASGPYASTFGFGGVASGNAAIAMGSSTRATALNATSMGFITAARGESSTTMGYLTIARSFATLTIGQNNDTTNMTDIDSWIQTDPVFVIGNGLDLNNRSNAMTVLKNGKTGINTTTPDAMLHVIKDAPSNGPSHSNAAAIIESAQSSFIQFSNGNTVQSGILSGNEETSIRSGIIFSGDSSVQIRAGGNNTKVFVRKDGNTGIGTVSPQQLLHVSKGASGATSAGSAAAVLEDNEDVSINLLSPDIKSTAIYFGNPTNAVHGGIVYNFPSTNGLNFRTNGNVTRAVLSSAGDLGIGDNTPDARLHVSEGVGGNLYTATAEVIIEDNDATHLQFSSPTNEESGILSGNAVTSIRSAIIFKADSSVQISAGGGNTRLSITKTGNTGIGTMTPGAKLDVNGTTILGVNGTSVTEIIKVTVLSDVPNVAAGSTVTETIPVPNSNTTSSVSISPASALQNGLLIAYARVSVAGTVEVKFTNTTGADINPPPMNFYITVIR